MHYNLLFNGCSITYGSELEGISNDIEHLEKNRFSHIISERTGKTYANIATGGSSNDRIVRRTIEWFEAGNTCDLAVIQLTFVLRREYISKYTGECSKFSKLNYVKSNNTHLKEDLVDYDQIRKAYYAYYTNCYNDNLGLTNFYKNLFILEQYFKSINVNSFYIKVKPQINIDYNKIIPWQNLCKNNYNEIATINGDILTSGFRGEDYAPRMAEYLNLGLNGSHPSEIGHQKIADYIIKHTNL